MAGKRKLSENICGAAGFILLGAVFIIDLQTEVGITDGLLYTGVLFLFLAVSNLRVIALAGILAILLDITGFLISPREPSQHLQDVSIINHAFSVGILVVCALLILRFRMSVTVLRSKMQELKDFKYALDEAAVVAITDKQGTLLKINDKFCEISKYTREELLGRKHTVVNCGEHAERFIQQLDKAVDEKRPLKGEFVNRAKDGSYYWVDTTVVPFINEDGEVYQYVAIGTDVTVRKQIEEQVIRQKQELEKFLYISSHDLQEPLRKIQSFISLIMEKEEYHLPNAVQQYLKKVSEAAKNIRSLIRGLVTYADFNKSVYELEPTDLAEITEKVKAELHDVIEEKHATVQYFGNCRPTVNHFQFYQLILNLVSNALKFSHPKIPPRIIIKCRVEKGQGLPDNQLSPDLNYCHITVQDNGIGFAAKDKDKIFQIFSTLHAKEKYAGTGMGLAIVKRIVDNHKGIIVASGELKKGATFDIYIPAPEMAAVKQVNKLTRLTG